MLPNAPASPGLDREEPEIESEDDIPTPATDESGTRNDGVASDQGAGRDKPIRE